MLEMGRFSCASFRVDNGLIVIKRLVPEKSFARQVPSCATTFMGSER